MNWFDDAINSDRKVWLTAISFAAAGGITAALLTRDGRSPSALVKPGAHARDLVDRLPTPSFLSNSASDQTELAARVRAINLERRE